MNLVSFGNADTISRFNYKSQLKLFIEEIFKRETVALASLQYIFCTDEYLLELNKQFLNHDYYTDIITFNLSDSTAMVGEVYISIDRVRDNALNLGISFQQEIQRVIFHGALHLCGYKDKRKAEVVTMRKKEEEYLHLFKDWKHTW